MVEITSMGRREFKFTRAVNTNSQAQKMSLDRSYTSGETSTRRLQQILNFLGRYKKNTSCTYSSLKNRIWLKIDQRIMHTRRYTELSTGLGSEVCTLFRLGTDVRYSYVSVGVKMHPYYTISKHRYELAAWFSD